MSHSPTDLHAQPPISAELWAAIVEHLALSPQQARIAGLIVQGRRDKEIMAELGIAKGTLRAYLERIHYRVGSHDRVQLLVRIFSLALKLSDTTRRAAC